MISKFVILGLVSLFAMCAGQAKVQVSVYYESLCPDSAAFITQQLTPTLRGPLGKYVDLTLIPYGKSTYVTQGSETNFTCHHGENECYGNKVHSCAVKNIEADSFQTGKTKQSKTIEFVNCLMKAGNTFPDQIYPTERCGLENEVKNWKSIHECANNTDGSNYLRQNGDVTNALNPKLTSVPTILFRQHYEREVQQMALQNFQGTLCKQIQPMPVECNNLPGSANENAVALLCLVSAFLVSRFF